jgi:hypothetical protein
MREEFGEGFDHLRMAAAYAAGTAAGVIAPRLDMMRERLEPGLERSKDMARGSARRAKKVARRATGKKEARMAKRWPMVVGGLMVAGVAVGAVGALLSRRRQRRWNDYGTTGTTTTSYSGLREDTRATASSIADTAKEKTSDVLGQVKGGTEGTGTTKATPSPTATTTRTGDFGTQAETYKPSTSSTGSRDSRP